tara:strand:- start:25050 stop:25580 length:531 start_codon:yes stop_codon:yes gene_type:complete
MNLKEVLMTLGNRLVTERGFDPATGADSPSSLNAKLVGTTVAIARFTNWLNETEEAREVLAEMGVGWPVAEPLPVGSEIFHAVFQGSERSFEAVGVAGGYLKCKGRYDVRHGSQVISMLIGEQHVRTDERKRFRETIVRMGGVVDGEKLERTSTGRTRTEAGRIGGEEGAGCDASK